MKPSTSGRDLGAAALIVEQSLAAPLANELSQYTANLRPIGYDVLAYTVSGGTPESLRTLLQHAYATHGITGALLVGNLPVPSVSGLQERLRHERLCRMALRLVLHGPGTAPGWIRCATISTGDTMVRVD